MKKAKFDPRSLLGKNLIEASGEAFVHQTHTIRVVNDNGVDVKLDEEDMSLQIPTCYDVNVKDGKIIFVHLRPWNDFKP
jgi:hypothetical protein